MKSLSFTQNDLAARQGIGTFFRRVVRHALASRRPQYWSELARDLAARGQDEEVLRCYDRALQLKPDVPQWLTNRSHAARNLGRYDEAEASLRRALQLEPDFAQAHLGLGNVLYSLGRTAEAQVSYRTALRLQPGLPGARFRLGLAHLKAGQFEEGWKWFERRWQVDAPPSFRGRQWNGEAVGDRVLLLFGYAAEGYGDTIQFCRYLSAFPIDARKIILAVRPSLVRLLSRLPGISEVIAFSDSLPAFDLQSSIMRLPYLVGTTWDRIPAATPYLTADPADVEHWRGRLAGTTGLRVGLCWTGQPGHSPGYIAWNRRRSIALETLVPLGEISGAQFISLQKDAPPDAAGRPRIQLHDFTADLRDFADTAALIENLDLVISIDTSVAHLAGALGKPVWLLNPVDACWRWLLNREDSPWYPTLRQFRQPMPWDWESVISRVRDALQRLAAGDRAQLRPPTLST
jgi:hypothetical protein